MEKSLLVQCFLFTSLAAYGCKSTSSRLSDADHTKRLPIQEPRVEEAASVFKKAMLHCSDQVWPNYNWNDVTVYFTDRDKQKAYRWDAVSGIYETTYKTVKPEFTANSYGYSRPGEKKELALSLTDDDDRYVPISPTSVSSLIQLAIHEGFHAFGQPSFTLQDNNPGAARKVYYPTDYMPRYLRYALAMKLLEYVHSRSDGALAQARDLLDQYQRDYSEESSRIAIIDILEGSAQYVQFKAAAVAMDNCAGNQAELPAVFTKLLAGTFGDNFNLLNTAAAESYVIGSLAGLALHLDGQSGWEKRVEQGETPQEILLKNITPIPAEVDNEKLNEAKTNAAEKNAKIKVALNEFHSLAQSGQALQFALSEERVMGSYNVNQTIYDQTTASSYYLGFSASTSVPSSSNVIALKDLTIRQQNHSTCGGNVLVFYVPKDQVTLTSDKLLNIDHPTVQVKQAPFRKAVDPNNGTIFCL